MSSPQALALLGVVLALTACDPFPHDVSLAMKREDEGRSLRVGERIPDTGETLVIGPVSGHVARGTPRFAELVRCDDPDVAFKDEEGTGADRMMTLRLRGKLSRLGALVAKEWPALRLRVTEAWDEKKEHGMNSVHYEGRAADLTTSDLDPKKLGRLSRLAANAGLDWVFYEDASHVHVSVRR